MVNRTVSELTELERVRYHNGQTLLSRDLRDDTAIVAQARWWHNRAVHDSFGVAEGMTVVLEGAPGDWSVRINPGLAYDVFGRELIHAGITRLKVPAPPFGLTLLARYLEESQECCGDSRRGACLPGSPPVATRGPDFLWKSSAILDSRDGVPLAVICAKQGSRGDPSTPHLDCILPPRPRRLARPLVAYGSTVPGATDWKLSELVLRSGQILLGIHLDVDTSAAAFTKVPFYFAWLVGSVAEPIVGHLTQLAVDHLEAESAAGFRFSLALPFTPNRSLTRRAVALTATLGERWLANARHQQLSVNWLGVQQQSSDVHF